MILNYIRDKDKGDKLSFSILPNYTTRLVCKEHIHEDTSTLSDANSEIDPLSCYYVEFVFFRQQ